MTDQKLLICKLIDRTSDLNIHISNTFMVSKKGVTPKEMEYISDTLSAIVRDFWDID